MSFRTAYGNRVSENGWRMCNRDECVVIDPPPGAHGPALRAMIVRSGDAALVMQAAAWYYHRFVEPLDLYRSGVGDDWGWSERNDVPNSNHLSGTAFDFNATQYPHGRRTMPADRVAKCEKMARDFEGMLFWGRWWDYVDEMHWQIGVPEFDPDGAPNRRLAAFAQKLRDGHLGLFGPPDPDAFPLPINAGAWGPTWYFGPLEGPEQSISNEWQPRPEWVAALKRFQTAAGIPATGVYDSATALVGRALQVRNGWNVTGHIYAGEWDAVIRHGQRPDLSAEPIGMEYADTSQWQAPVGPGYPHIFHMFRANNGNDVDRAAKENLGQCVSMVNDPSQPMRGFGVYTFWRPGEDNLGTLKRVVGNPHPRMVVMIDVESAEGSTKGTVRGDQSAGVNQYLADVREWIGDPDRVHLGYLNAKINLGLWQTRPKGVVFVHPDYSAPKGSPRTTVDGWAIHQYTDKGRCAPWGDAPIDLNYFNGTPTEFLVMLGLDKAPIREPADPTPPTPGLVPFPLSPGYAYGPLDGPAHAISGQWRDDTEAQREGLRRYQRALGVEPTGVWTAGSPTDLATRKIQEARGWKPEGPGWVYQGEWDVVVNGLHPVTPAADPKPTVPAAPTYCATCPCAPREGETEGD